MRELLADGRCSQEVLDFLLTTDVGRRVPGAEEDDAVSAVSELEVREWLEEQGAGGPRSRTPGGGNYRCSYPRLTSWRRQAGGRVAGCAFPLFLPFVNFLGRVYLSSWDRHGRRAKGCLQQAATARTADRKTDCTYSRHDLHRSHASNE